MNLIRSCKNRLYLLKKSISLKERYLSKHPYYRDVDFSIIVINWIFQKIFKLNYDAPFSVNYTSKIDGASNIKFIGNEKTILKSFALSGGCYFGISNNTTLEIGEGTIWAFNVSIQTSNHDLLDRTKLIGASVKIGRNCWLGNSSTILAGVELGDNVTVGANTVVTKSFPSNVVIAGCPAKIIKEING
jgi:acetyltransferase-like isoleucine patch superfamily enzyme